MRFYEATSSWIGESYVRMYVWADGDLEATRLLQERIAGTKYADSKWSINELFRDETPAFCTLPSDCGFEMPEKL